MRKIASAPPLLAYPSYYVPLFFLVRLGVCGPEKGLCSFLVSYVRDTSVKIGYP
jgi:hypothetical protein